MAWLQRGPRDRSPRSASIHASPWAIHTALRSVVPNVTLTACNANLARRGAPVVRLLAVADRSHHSPDPHVLTDPRLVVRIAARDQTAMAELYDAARSPVFGLALRILGDRAAAEDVVIEVFAQCWRQVAGFDSAKGSVMAWLFNLTRSRAIDAVRVRRRQVAGEPLDEVAPALRSDDPDPVDVSIHAEQQRLVRRALQSLSPAQRQAIELAFFSDLSHSQIATRLNQPLGTVKTRLRDGMLKLRQELEPLAEPGERRRA